MNTTWPAGPLQQREFGGRDAENAGFKRDHYSPQYLNPQRIVTVGQPLSSEVSCISNVSKGMFNGAWYYREHHLLNWDFLQVLQRFYWWEVCDISESVSLHINCKQDSETVQICSTLNWHFIYMTNYHLLVHRSTINLKKSYRTKATYFHEA